MEMANINIGSSVAGHKKDFLRLILKIYEIL